MSDQNHFRNDPFGFRAAMDVMTERDAQIKREGYQPADDDRYTHGEMAQAAASYALQSAPLGLRGFSTWPWSYASFKPRTPRENLVRAGALILAEIERLDRAAAMAPWPAQDDTGDRR